MRNIKTREGYEFWDKICALKNYGFLLSADRMRVVKTEGIGNWIDMHDAHEIVDQAQEEVNDLKERLADAERRNAPIDIEAAAKKLAACMDYPWEYMPEQGRASMREHAKAIIEAASHDSQAIS